MECIDVNRRGQDLDNYNWIRDAEKEQAGSRYSGTYSLSGCRRKNEYRPPFQ